jgi:plasmid stabilization system protein ParE
MALSDICTQPNIYRNYYKNFYEFTISKFPFSIMYTFNKEEKRITVISVFHQKRNPKKRFIK